MSDAPAKPTPLALLSVLGIVVVADAAMYKNVFELLGMTGGVAFMVLGSIFVIGCVWWLERRG